MLQALTPSAYGCRGSTVLYTDIAEISISIHALLLEYKNSKESSACWDRNFALDGLCPCNSSKEVVGSIVDSAEEP